MPISQLIMYRLENPLSLKLHFGSLWVLTKNQVDNNATCQTNGLLQQANCLHSIT